MAIKREVVLPNGDVVRYHHISTFTYRPGGSVIATLDSYRDLDHRGWSHMPVVAREIEFPHSGNSLKLAEEAYAYIMNLPEWAESVKV